MHGPEIVVVSDIFLNVPEAANFDQGTQLFPALPLNRGRQELTGILAPSREHIKGAYITHLL
jgi:hypothetical protein